MEKDRIRKEYTKLKKQLSHTGFICTGSVLSVYHTCGNAYCSCSTDKSALHGPYNRWTRKEKGKTISRTLTDRQTEMVKKFISNYRTLEKILKEMKRLSVEFIEIQKKSKA
jgi:hypothetical protein